MLSVNSESFMMLTSDSGNVTNKRFGNRGTEMQNNKRAALTFTEASFRVLAVQVVQRGSAI